MSKLYIDALNYGTYFFCDSKYSWSLQRPYERVKEFVSLLKKAGFEPVVFIDEGFGTEEASEKWLSRRMNEVEHGLKEIPQGMSNFLGDMFRKEGVVVNYSMFHDNDDTLAFHADADGASVLSRDGDFYRYIGRKYKIYSNFTIDNDKIELITNSPEREAVIMKSRKNIMREIEPPPAVVDQKYNIAFVPILKELKLYKRGVPSPLVRKLNFNPHLRLQPVRRAIYTLLFEDQGSVILEQFPVWSKEENTTIVHSEYVIPFEKDDKEFLELSEKLSKNPDFLFEDYFYNEYNTLKLLSRNKHINVPEGVVFRDWQKHCIACKTLTYELCCIVNGKTLLSFFLK